MTLIVAIIVLNVVVTLSAWRATRGEDGAASTLEGFLFIPFQVARGQNGIGMLLAHFAHAGVAHLVFNMLALYSFAGPVLAVVGALGFLVIYALAGLGSDLVVFALHKDDPEYRCLGASGSVFGIMMAAVVLDPTTSIVLFIAPVPIPGPVFMIVYAVVSAFLIRRNRRGGVSHEGHLAGAVVGLAITVILAPAGLSPLLRWFAQWL